MVIDPSPEFVTISQTTKTLTLDMNGNSEGEMFFGWFLKTVLSGFSHTQLYYMYSVSFKCLRMGCLPTITTG